ncbi:hypothetical protein GT204_17695 [Streptomyces sp. SID4919]|uniref:hypothetical protein n=1 Tax=Streptomyces TaxID=1883 RepID=UPI0008238D03|nr:MULTISPECIES: hypothetical protein [unclassified Streptomyces]MYY10695.1 hypothetical protein [Streptomyces sp. SID4919]SCK62318.1 hypothetical protein YW7DRAFT_06573 [Streptomyces sp. AmelKG-E11A]
MTYKVTLDEDAKRGMAQLTPARRRAVHEAMQGPLAARPLTVGRVKSGSGPTALRVLALESAGVSIGYRVYNDRVEVTVVWLLGHP